MEYVTLRRTIPEDQGRVEALESIAETALGGLVVQPRDYDLARNGQATFMAQECSKKWEDACDIYISNLQPKDVNKFLEDTARRRYCVMPEIAKSHCKYNCRPVNPTYPDSPDACKWEGGNFYYVNDGPTMGADVLEYTKQISCEDSLICSIPYPQSKYFDNDPVIQRCLTWNSCQNFFAQLKDTQNLNVTPNSDGLIPKPYVPVMADGNVSKPQYYPDMTDQGYYNESNGRYCDPTRVPIEQINAEISREEMMKKGYDCECGSKGLNTVCMCKKNGEHFKVELDHRKEGCVCDCPECSGKKGCNCCAKCWKKHNQKKRMIYIILIIGLSILLAVLIYRLCAKKNN